MATRGNWKPRCCRFIPNFFLCPMESHTFLGLFKHAARRFLLGSVGGDLTHVKPAGKRSGQSCGVWGERVWLVLCPYHVPCDYDGNGYSPAALSIEKSRGCWNHHKTTEKSIDTVKFLDKPVSNWQSTPR